MPAKEEFSTKDSAFTFGGPIVRDKAWFFGSYRYTNRQDDVSTLDTKTFLRSIEPAAERGAGRLQHFHRFRGDVLANAVAGDDRHSHA